MENSAVGNGWKFGLFNICVGIVLVVGMGLLSLMYYGIIGGEQGLTKHLSKQISNWSYLIVPNY